MCTYPAMRSIAAALLVSLACGLALAQEPQWSPGMFRDESVIEVYTVGPDGSGHWSSLWVVVVDGNPYLRLGTRAATRIRENRDAPYIRVRVAGQEFERVKVVEAPEMTDRVMEAFAQKYWLDSLIRPFRREMIARLVKEDAAKPAPPQNDGPTSHPPGG